MLTYLQTPAQRRRNMEDRLARLSTKRKARSRTGSREDLGRDEEGRKRASEGERAARRILEAGRSSGSVEVEPEAERAARFILSAEDEPAEDVDEAVDMIKQAGRDREDRDEDESE